jgi:RND superfamily putative drug exporter
VRDGPAPFPVLVGGTGAVYADSLDAVGDGLVPALAIIALSTFVLLFLMTGSVVIPAKAIVLNVLSLTATMGAMVWIFQEGNLKGLFGDFNATGTITFTAPVLLFCIAFGLSMDYEVFLISRIKEEHDRTGDNVASVASGLQRSGRLITAAAAVVSLVFIGLVFSSVSYMKMLGFGLALAVLMDATLVRGTLVPAFMRLLGDVNWWSPRFLRPVYRRFAISEGGGSEEASERPAPRERVSP